MSYVLNIFNPLPATSIRVKKVSCSLLSQAISEIEAYVAINTKTGYNSEDAHIVSGGNGIMKFRYGNVVFVIEAIPFSLSQDELLRGMEFENEGQCRKYKNPPTKTPNFTVTVNDTDVKTVIFRENVGVDTYDPTEVFTHEFLVGIGYYKNEGGQNGK